MLVFKSWCVSSVYWGLKYQKTNRANQFLTDLNNAKRLTWKWQVSFLCEPLVRLGFPNIPCDWMGHCHSAISQIPQLHYTVAISINVSCSKLWTSKSVERWPRWLEIVGLVPSPVNPMIYKFILVSSPSLAYNINRIGKELVGSALGYHEWVGNQVMLSSSWCPKGHHTCALS